MVMVMKVGVSAGGSDESRRRVNVRRELGSVMGEGMCIPWDEEEQQQEEGACLGELESSN